MREPEDETTSSTTVIAPWGHTNPEFEKHHIAVDELSPSELLAATLDALEAWNTSGEPQLFKNRAGEFVRVAKSALGQPRIVALKRNELVLVLMACAEFTREGKSGKVEVNPLSTLVDNVFHSPHKPVPILTTIYHSPVFSRDLRYRCSPGFHQKLEAIIAYPDGLTVRPLPKLVTRQHIRMAKRVLRKLLRDFPWASPTDLANAVALAITLIVRPAIDGPVPLFAVNKPCQGTGGTLLILAIVMAALGFSPTPFTEARSGAEWKKMLFAVMRSNGLVGFLDNVSEYLETKVLCAILTCYPVYTDRILGVSNTGEVAATVVWMLTGNNVRMTAEVARRVVPILLDPGVEDPLRRKPEGRDFLALRHYVPEHQADFFWALGVLVKAWRDAGQPKPSGQKLPMFEEWFDIVGGVVEYAGYAGFMSNLGALVDATPDPDQAHLHLLLPAWHERFGGKSVSAREVVSFAHEAGLPIVPPELPGTGKAVVDLGFFLSRCRNRVAGGFKLVPRPSRGGVACYCVTQVEESDTTSESDDSSSE